MPRPRVVVADELTESELVVKRAHPLDAESVLLMRINDGPIVHVSAYDWQRIVNMVRGSADQGRGE